MTNLQSVELEYGRFVIQYELGVGVKYTFSGIVANKAKAIAPK